MTERLDFGILGTHNTTTARCEGGVVVCLSKLGHRIWRECAGINMMRESFKEMLFQLEMMRDIFKGMLFQLKYDARYFQRDAFSIEMWCEIFSKGCFFNWKCDARYFQRAAFQSDLREAKMQGGAATWRNMLRNFYFSKRDLKGRGEIFLYKGKQMCEADTFDTEGDVWGWHIWSVYISRDGDTWSERYFLWIFWHFFFTFWLHFCSSGFNTTLSNIIADRKDLRPYTYLRIMGLLEDILRSRNEYIRTRPDLSKVTKFSEATNRTEGNKKKNRHKFKFNQIILFLFFFFGRKCKTGNCPLNKSL